MLYVVFFFLFLLLLLESPSHPADEVHVPGGSLVEKDGLVVNADVDAVPAIVSKE